MRNANFTRIIVAALAAFVTSSAWYTIFGGVMTRLNGAGSTAATSTGSPAGTMLFVVAQSLVVALMVAYLVSRLGISDRNAALRLGALIWIFPASILLGSVVHENVPPAFAAIHAGDWLAKLLVMSVVLGARRSEAPPDAPDQRLPQGESRSLKVDVVGR